MMIEINKHHNQKGSTIHYRYAKSHAINNLKDIQLKTQTSQIVVLFPKEYQPVE